MNGKNMLVKECMIAKSAAGKDIAKAGKRIFLVDLVGDITNGKTLEYFWKVKKEIHTKEQLEFSKCEAVTDYLIYPL